MWPFPFGVGQYRHGVDVGGVLQHLCHLFADLEAESTLGACASAYHVQPLRRRAVAGSGGHRW
jgi:hypothetical protein